jgi:hypothetical protein
MNKETLDILMYEYRIPYYVVHRHIIPYTYLPQSKGLLRDIRNYTQDIKLIEDTYYTRYNEFILLTDLLLYHGYSYNLNYISNTLLALMNRHIQLKHKDIIDLNNYIITITKSSKRKRNIKFIWGLMTPDERNEFINKYLIDDDMLV